MALMNRVRLVGIGVAGAPYYQNLYFAAEGGTAQQQTDAVKTLFTAIAPVEVSGLVWTADPFVAVIESTTGDIVNQVTVTQGTSVPGSASGDPLPLQAQMGVSMSTGSYVAGRAIRGHFSIPYVSETFSSTGQGPNTASTAVIAIQTALTALAASSTVDWVVYSRKNGQYAVVNQARISPRWFTLKSRQV